MEERKELSICIASYNRMEMVIALIKKIMNKFDDKINIIITDNGSMKEELDKIKPFLGKNVILYRNEPVISATNNVIRAIFNGNGRYVLYLNDREDILVDRIKKLLEVLKDKTYAFIQTVEYSNFNDYSLIEYKAGIESISNIGFARHPSGMVFNSDILSSKYKDSDFFEETGSYPWERIIRAVSLEANTAIYNCGVWQQPQDQFFLNNISNGGMLSKANRKAWFGEYFITQSCICSLKDQLYVKQAKLSIDETLSIQIKMISFFFDSLKYYKKYSNSKSQCAHYGIRTHTVFLLEYIRVNNIFIEEIYDSLNDNPELKKWLSDNKKYYKIRSIKNYYASYWERFVAIKKKIFPKKWIG